VQGESRGGSIYGGLSDLSEQKCISGQVGSNMSSLPWWEGVRGRGKLTLTPNPLPSRERETK